MDKLELVEMLSTMLGMAETDGLDRKSNEWRSIMIRVNEVLRKNREAASDIDMFEMDEEGNPDLDSRYGTDDDPRIPLERYIDR